MRSPTHRSLIRLTAVLAIVGIGEWSVLLAHASQSPTWLHWLCSPSALHSSVLHAGQVSVGSSRECWAPWAPIAALAGHILPILLALWTWRICGAPMLAIRRARFGRTPSFE